MRGLPEADVVAVDADTRPKSAARAAAEVARLIRAHPAGIVYKKIDSTLRGHVKVEIAAALEAYRGIGHPDAVAVVAPAFPAMGRITRRGRQYSRGVAIDGESLPPLCDAETDDDLRALVAERVGRDVLWAGSGGLIRVLAEGLPKQPPAKLERLDGLIVFAAGSRSERTREQVETLRAAGVDGVEILAAEPAVLGRAIAARRGNIGALVLTGGDTARAVLSALDISVLRAAGEVETGVPLLLPEGSRPLPVVTKAGDFGDGETLLRVGQLLLSLSR